MMLFSSSEVESARLQPWADFAALPTPTLHVGLGTRHKLPEIVRQLGARRALFVRGGQSLDTAGHADALLEGLAGAEVEAQVLTVRGEPEVEDFAADLRRLRGQKVDSVIDIVIAVGGGSALDFGKGMAGMLAVPGELMDYLEGVGRGLAYPGGRLALVALPTSAGTGAESTHNAVFGRRGDDGFKKSLRHASLIPDVAILDPELQVSMPPSQTAACGMDALTQCIESWLSTKASPHSDLYAQRGIQALARGLPRAWAEPGDLEARSLCAYGAYCSGIALAHAGLGIVHGFAPLLGAYYGVPHGVACGRVMAAANAATLAQLRRSAPGHPALDRYAWLGRVLLAGQAQPPEGDDWARAGICELERWTRQFNLPALASFGVDERAITRLVSPAINRNNPVALDDEALAGILRACLHDARAESATTSL